MFPDFVWPRNDKNRKLKDYGCLPLVVPEVVTYLADPTHRKKSSLKPLFKHAKSTKKVNVEGLTVSDCERLQVNIGYFIKCYRHLPLSEFAAKASNVIDHHFNRHDNCGAWCPYSMERTEDEREVMTADKAKKYRCVEKDSDMYELVKTKMGPYLQLDALKDINHLFDTQLNEAMNKLISKYAPKNRVFCGTSSLQGRVYFALGVHSVKLPNFITAFCEKFGFKEPKCVSLFLEQKQKKVTYHNEYKKKLTTKRKRSNNKKMKHKVMLEREKKEERSGVTYRSGVNLLHYFEKGK